MLSKLLKWFLATALLGALLFGLAGRLDLPMFWAYTGVFSIVLLVAFLTIDDHGLSEERRRPGPGGVDRAMRFIAAPLLMAHLVIGGLDAGRFHWSDAVPRGLQLAALVVFTAGMGVQFWAMAANTFFSPVVRIQTDRGHRVVSDGPYRYLRHPGYLGMILLFGSSGLVLGSLWSLLPAFVFTILVLRRLLIEDRYLKEHLPGYRPYADRVRYRLVPGVW